MARACDRRSARRVPSCRVRAAAATHSAVARSCAGYGSSVATIRSRQRMGGEQHPGRGRACAASLARTSAATNSTNAGSVAQLSISVTAMSCSRGRGRQSIEVLADRERRVVRRQHQPDDASKALRRPARSTDCSMNGAACFMPSMTWYPPGAMRRARPASHVVAPRCVAPTARSRRSPRSERSVRRAARRSAVGRAGCRCSTARCRRASAACRTPISITAVRGLGHRAVRSLTWSTTALQHAGIGVGLHAVAEVEDVAGMRPTIGIRLSASTASVPASAVSAPASTSAGSRLPCTTRSAPMRRRASVIDVRQSSPSTRGACGVHRLEEVITADAEVDPGALGVAAGERCEDRGGMGQHERVVVGAAQRTGPRVEQLERSRTVIELAARSTRSACCVKPLHQPVPQRRSRCASAAWCVRRCGSGRPSMR